MTNRQTTRITRTTVNKATKLFGTVRALNGLTLEAASGEVLAVMGANGAGKSTLLSLLSLNAKPTRGEVLFNAQPADETIRRKIGILSHAPMVYPDLTAEENLRLFAKLYHVPQAERRTDALIAEMGIEPFRRNRPVRVLSRGQLQRVALARAVLHQPDLLLLDEPAAGLDGKAIGRIETVINAHTDRGGIAVVVTHEPEVAARIATRAVMIRRGSLVTDTPAPGSADAWRTLYLKAVEGEN